MTTTAYSQIIIDIAKKIAAAQDEEVVQLTADSGSTTTLVDAAALKETTADDDTHYVHKWARITDVTDNTTVSSRKISAYAPSAGTLTWLEAAGFTVVAGDTATIHYVCQPSVVEDAINEILRRSRYSTFQLLTAVTDGDMEDTTADPPNWTESAGQTLSKETTIVRHGVQSLKIDQNSAVVTTYVASDAIDVVEYESWDVIALLKCTTGGGKLVAYDNTSGAEIDSWEADETAWSEIGLPFTIPSGCESLVFRLHGTTTTSVVYWDSVWAKKVEQRIIDLPSWVNKRKHIKDVFYYPAGLTRTNDSRSVMERRPHPFNSWSWLQDETAATPWRIEIDDPARRPIYLDCRRPYAELSVETTTTTMDRETLVAGALMIVYDDKGEDFTTEYRRWRDKYHELASIDNENRPDVEMVSAYSPYR